MRSIAQAAQGESRDAIAARRPPVPPSGSQKGELRLDFGVFRNALMVCGSSSSVALSEVGQVIRNVAILGSERVRRTSSRVLAPKQLVGGSSKSP